MIIVVQFFPCVRLVLEFENSVFGAVRVLTVHTGVPGVWSMSTRTLRYSEYVLLRGTPRHAR